MLLLYLQCLNMLQGLIYTERMAGFADRFIVKTKFVAEYPQYLEVVELKRKKRLEERARKVFHQVK